jgi:hypothetical protein
LNFSDLAGIYDAESIGPGPVRLHTLRVAPAMAAGVRDRLWRLEELVTALQNKEKLMRGRIWLGVLICSTIGGFIPDLWGAGLFSYSSVLLSGIGAFVGLWLAIRMS